MRDVRAVKSRHKRDNSILVAVIVLFAAMAAVGLYYIYQLNTRPLKQTAIKSEDVSQTDVLSDNTEKLTDLSIKSHEYRASSGKNYLRVHVDITNVSDGEIQFSPLLQFQALDSIATAYPFTAELTRQPLGGPIPKGGHVEGDIDFAVLNTDSIRALQYRDSPSGTYYVYQL